MHTRVGIIMGSRSEWSTMNHAAKLLAKLGIPYEERIITAYRNKNRLHDYASKAIDRGLEIIIAGSGGAADLPGILASKTELPVLGVPIKTGSPGSECYEEPEPHNNTSNPSVDMLASGQTGAVNAALLAASMLGDKYPYIRENLVCYRGMAQPWPTSQEN